MSFAETLLAEFEQEARTTRKFLERLPEHQLAWKPHEKSMSAGQLALHIAVAPGQVVQIARQDSIPVPNFDRENPQPASLKEILDALDASIDHVRQILPAFTDEQLQHMWRMQRDGRDVFAVPRAVMLRNILLNHWYHHRGQFGVYLRLVGAQVPSAYGPSGDELPEFLKKQAVMG
ncbi:MAG: DinB family protein [Planctomycetaceae bacterium]